MKTSFQFQAVTFAILFGTLTAYGAPVPTPGPLEQQVLDTYRLGDTLDDCERLADQKALRVTLARALDAHTQEITDFLRLSARTNRLSFSDPSLLIGPLSLIARADAPKPSGEKKPKTNGWVAYTSGWTDFDQEYQAVRDQPVNARWVRLYGLVRATVADDYTRTVIGTWMGASPEGVDESANLVKIGQACLTDKKCDDLLKSDAFKNALKLTPDSAKDYADFLAAKKDDAKATRALKNLVNETKPFTTYYDPVKQSGVRLSDANTIVISLDAGDFRNHETELGLAIEKFWKVASNVVKVEWMTSTRDEPIFKFFFQPMPRSGNMIDYIRRTITIGQGAIESIPAHEIGRAMGFRARTFSVWHADTCKYEDLSKPDDLMSDGRLGSVTAAHWEALKKAYGPTP